MSDTTIIERFDAVINPNPAGITVLRAFAERVKELGFYGDPRKAFETGHFQFDTAPVRPGHAWVRLDAHRVSPARHAGRAYVYAEARKALAEVSEVLVAVGFDEESSRAYHLVYHRGILHCEADSAGIGQAYGLLASYRRALPENPNEWAAVLV